MSCSIDEPTMTVAEKRAKARAVHVGFCCKCKTTKSTIIVRYAEYCDPCFLIALDSKFRTALRNARPYRVVTPENVMLAFSGGSSSRSLIHLFDVFHSLPPEVVSNKQQPKIYNDIHVCHIDESSLFESTIQSQEQTDSSINHNGLPQSTMVQAQSIVAKYGYKFHGVRIEDIYDPEWTDSRCFEAVATLITSLPRDQLVTSGQAPELLSKILPLSTDATFNNKIETPSPDQERPKLSQQEKIEKLKTLLGVCTTLTAREMILQHFKSSLLIQLAKRAKCTILALGDSATRVAIQIIGLTATGRGFSLPHETSLLSNWVQDCKVIRPLKDCLVKELDTYCSLNSLELIERHSANLDWSVKTKGDVKSIKRLTEDFITGLDKDFPSTVATVCRTAAKLTPPEVTYENKCPLCLGPVQEGVQEWKERITVTTAPPDSSNNATNVSDGCCSSNGAVCCGGGANNGSASSCLPPLSKDQDSVATLPFSSLLCYGCLTNLRDLDLKSMSSEDSQEGSLFVLPPYVAETILDRSGYSSLEDYKQPTSSSRDPRESLREQIKDFLIDSDDEDEV
ncbi:Cytoplasmic tRNA 2-thiolation protein 2 [Entomortierella chlamydospora]|uniref:Cytoplasmic tRNA 2-thiolation protein 2 n=1 Tax=Entomortierella chlamydospora TaxID=101097 RepID=A0A9P6SWU4_9FUNG|nr:Cytoplasmic tRNA 2-thiolation protein 2 [Entomortierella chlamydospora]